MKLTKISKIALYILCVFIFQELVFRYFYPIPEVKNFDRVNFTYLYSGNQGSKHSRDHIWEWQSELDTTVVFKHFMNRYGFRDREWLIEKTKNKKRAFFIGDSFIEGVMAEQNETIPLAFEKASNDHYETFNGGMLGCGLDAYLQLAADAIPLYKPDVAFLCIYANDLGKEEPRIPELYLEPKYFNTFTPRLIEVFSQMKTYGPLNFRWKNTSEPYLPAVPNTRNPWTNSEENLKEHVTPQIAIQMKQAVLNPFLTNALIKEETYLKIPPKLGETIQFFKYICNENGTKPIVVYIPSRNQVTDNYLQFEKQYCLRFPDSISLNTPEYQIHQQYLKTECQDLNVQFIDLTETIRQQESKGNHLYWNYDQHMKAKGYNLLGQTIWNKLQLN